MATAYPIYAQTAYENPRESTGRMVCANCHLVERPVEIQVPQSVFPDTVFEAVVEIPYDINVKQLVSTGKKGSLNVGAILVLPEGFKLAPTNRLSEDLKVKTEKLFILPYSKSRPNILVLGPLVGSKNRRVVFPILAPNRVQNKDVAFLNYPFYVGGNRGRGQIYPDGEKSNNIVVASSLSGRVASIEYFEQSGIREVLVESVTGEKVKHTVPRGLEILVKVGEKVDVDQPLTVDPNVGGFGQGEGNVVFQDAQRIQALIFFLLTVTFSQIFFVFKKKQFEKVQEVELNF
jgi:apocytochrome f